MRPVWSLGQPADYLDLQTGTNPERDECEHKYISDRSQLRSLLRNNACSTNRCKKTTMAGRAINQKIYDFRSGFMWTCWQFRFSYRFDMGPVSCKWGLNYRNCPNILNFLVCGNLSDLFVKLSWFVRTFTFVLIYIKLLQTFYQFWRYFEWKRASFVQITEQNSARPCGFVYIFAHVLLLVFLAPKRSIDFKHHGF